MMDRETPGAADLKHAAKQALGKLSNSERKAEPDLDLMFDEDFASDGGDERPN